MDRRLLPEDNQLAVRARLEQWAACTPMTMSSLQPEDIRALLAAYDDLLAERDHAIANLVEVHDRWAKAEADRDQAAPVLDDVMTTLDWVSTTTEGTPKPPFLEIHRRVGEQMRRINAWRAAREG